MNSYLAQYIHKLVFFSHPNHGTNFFFDMIGKRSKAILTKELSNLHERVKALEADNGFLEHVPEKLPDGSEGATLLTEISNNLHKLFKILS